MFTTLVSLALFSSLAIRGAVADFTITSPQLVECQDAHISWEGGNAPYNLIVVPNDSPCDDVLVDLGDHNVNSITWKANITAGTKVLLSLEDKNGDEAWSDTITVAAGSDKSCLLAAGPTASASGSPAPSQPPSATTLSLPASLDPPLAVGAPPPAQTSEPPAVAVGGVEQGVNPLGLNNGASGIHKISASAVVLTAIAGVFASLF